MAAVPDVCPACRVRRAAGVTPIWWELFIAPHI